MSPIIITTILTVVVLGVIAALILYFAAQKFKVFEDPRIDEVDDVLPGANCGGCGYAGCRQFAEATVKADELGGLYCPVGGNDCMSQVANVLGKTAVEKEAMVAVLRCHGTLNNRAKSNDYDGVSNCTVASNLYSGDTGCQHGCLGLGECVDVCDFNALHMDSETGLPVVNQDNCTACNACVEVCPKSLFELRKKGKKDKRIFVSCMNTEKGGVAKKACSTACIGCKKCEKVCPADAIDIKNFLAYIDYNKCILCRKCVVECPTEAIHEVNFPPRRPKKDKPSIAKSAELKPDTPVKDIPKSIPKNEPNLAQMAKENNKKAEDKPKTDVAPNKPESTD